MSEVEIQDELKDKGVDGVDRVTLKKEGKVIPTNTLFFFFFFDVRFPRTPERDHDRLSKGEGGFV